MRSRDKCTSNSWQLSKKIRPLTIDNRFRKKLIWTVLSQSQALSKLWLSWSRQQLRRKSKRPFKTHNTPNVLRAFNSAVSIQFQIQESSPVISSICQLKLLMQVKEELPVPSMVSTWTIALREQTSHLGLVNESIMTPAKSTKDLVIHWLDVFTNYLHCSPKIWRFTLIKFWTRNNISSRNLLSRFTTGPKKTIGKPTKYVPREDLARS